MTNYISIKTNILLWLFLLNILSVNAQTFSIGSRQITTPEKGTYSADTIGTVNSTSCLDTYGGWFEMNVGATGYFYTKEIDSKWYLVDPDGYVFITIGVTSVEEGGGINLPSALADWGINTMGNWSDDNIKNYPICVRYSFLSNFKNTSTYRKDLFNDDIFPVFDPEFASWVDGKAKDFVADYKNNPWVLGYHTDNELRFHYVNINDYLALTSTDAHYTAAYNWMMTKHGYISPVSDDDINGFRAYVAETYMKTVNTALKKYDPNHLNLGCRIHSSVKFDKQLVTAIGNNVDVNSINFYGRWEPSQDDMNMWIEDGKSPFLITEFYTKALDTDLTNEDGAGWQVYTQTDRAHHFENMALTLLSHRGSVGWTWFKYIDKNDSNKGIVDSNYNWYTELLLSMKNISKDVYNLRRHLFGQELIPNSCTLSNNNQLDNNKKTPSLYPLPAINNLNIDFPEGSAYTKYKIYAINGLLIKEGKVESKQMVIDISELKQGMYLSQFSGESEMMTRKFNKLKL